MSKQKAKKLPRARPEVLPTGRPVLRYAALEPLAMELDDSSSESPEDGSRAI